MNFAGSPRDGRQRVIMAWACRAFTVKVARNTIERCLRFFEEAAELVHALGLTRAQCDAVLDRVFSRPKGKPEQEIGQAGMTLLALAECEGYSADECEAAEIKRVLALPDDHWRKRQNAKAEQGLGGKVPA